MMSLQMMNYWVALILVVAGLYVTITTPNILKKIIGLMVFQTATFFLYIAMGKVTGGTAPILQAGVTSYSNPLPHVLILTAIVVGVATTAVALAIMVRIKEAYGSIQTQDIEAADAETDLRETPDAELDMLADARRMLRAKEAKQTQEETQVLHGKADQ